MCNKQKNRGIFKNAFYEWFSVYSEKRLFLSKSKTSQTGMLMGQFWNSRLRRFT